MWFFGVVVSWPVALVAGVVYLAIRLWPVTLLAVLLLVVDFMAGRPAEEIALVVGLVVLLAVGGALSVLALRWLLRGVERGTERLMERWGR